MDVRIPTSVTDLNYAWSSYMVFLYLSTAVEIGFVPSSYTVNEDAGTVILLVRKTGQSSIPISVTITTFDHTAGGRYIISFMFELSSYNLTFQLVSSHSFCSLFSPLSHASIPLPSPPSPFLLSFLAFPPLSFLLSTTFLHFPFFFIFLHPPHHMHTLIYLHHRSERFCGNNTNFDLSHWRK